jgi:hypothetical protein
MRTSVINGRGFPSRGTHLTGPVVGGPAAVAPFTSTVVLSGRKGGTPHTQRPKYGPYVLNIEPPAIPTTEFLQLIVLAKWKGIQPQQRSRIVVAPPVIGPPVPLRPVPEYMGLVLLAGQRGPRFALPTRPRFTQFRYTPTSGFAGAKNGFLSVEPRRSDTNMTITPHRSGSITVQ